MPEFDLRRILGNSGWLMSARVTTLLVTLLVGVLIARHLGPSAYGQLSYLLAFVGLFTPLGAMGLNFVVTRALLERPQDTNQILFTSLVVRLLGGTAALAIMLAVHLAIDPAARQERLFVAWLGLSAVSLATLTYESWFQAHVAARFLTLARAGALLTGAAIKITLVALESPLESFVLAGVLDNLLLGMTVAIAYKSHSRTAIGGAFKREEALKLLARSKWLVLSGLMAAVYLRIDLVMLRHMSSVDQAGIYAVAARLSEAWYFAPTAIAASFFPALLSARAKDPQSYRAMLQTICNGLLLLALAVAVLTSLVSKPLIGRLFGDVYGESATILSIHVWAGLFISMRALLSKWLILEELYKYSLLSQGLGAVVNVLANLLMIPHYGATGAAVATLISYAAASYLVLFFSARTRPAAQIMTTSLLLPIGGNHILRWLAAARPAQVPRLRK